MDNNKDKKDLNNSLDEFMGETSSQNDENCNTEECRLKRDRSLVERINKKIITEDGKQLLI